MAFTTLIPPRNEAVSCETILVARFGLISRPILIGVVGGSRILGLLLRGPSQNGKGTSNKRMKVVDSFDSLGKNNENKKFEPCRNIFKYKALNRTRRSTYA